MIYYFQIIVVLGAVLGTIIYRVSLVSVIYGGGGFFLKKHAKIFTSMTAALINLTIIMILTKVSLFCIAILNQYLFILSKNKVRKSVKIILNGDQALLNL